MSRCSSVANPVLVNMSAVLGLVMSLAYCLGDPESLIISSRITSVTWQQWANFTGECCECSCVYAEQGGAKQTIRRQGCSVALPNSLANLLFSIPLVLYP